MIEPNVSPMFIVPDSWHASQAEAAWFVLAYAQAMAAQAG